MKEKPSLTFSCNILHSLNSTTHISFLCHSPSPAPFSLIATIVLTSSIWWARKDLYTHDSHARSSLLPDTSLSLNPYLDKSTTVPRPASLIPFDHITFRYAIICFLHHCDHAQNISYIETRSFFTKYLELCLEQPKHPKRIYWEIRIFDTKVSSAKQIIFKEKSIFYCHFWLEIL